jgi:mRNA-degrading endonuclease toxin of MazEF toxin-antitoxin module
MTIYKRGDIVLVAFVYSENRQKFKRRPALIVQADGISCHPGKFITAQITSAQWFGPTRVTLDPNSPDWKETGLLGPSVIVTDVLETFHQDMFIRAIGRITDMSAIDQALKTTFGLS